MSAKKEIAALIVITAVFIIFCRTFSTALVPVWRDEVSYADPAINFLLGRGFSSSCWDAQESGKFFAANTPLYEVTLIPYLAVTGIDIISVRMFDVFWGALAALLLWWAVKRKEYSITPARRLLLISIFLFGEGNLLIFNQSRPDAIAVMLSCLALAAVSIKNARTKKIILITTGAAMAWTGLQIPAWVAVTAVIYTVFFGRRRLKDFIYILAGSCLGVFLLFLLYITKGVAGDFIYATFTHHTIMGERGLWERFGKAFSLSTVKITARGDETTFILAVFSAAAVFINFIKNKKFKKQALFGFIYFITVPVVMAVLGKWMTYYSWMVSLPVALAFISTISEKHVQKVSIPFITTSLLIAAPTMTYLCIKDAPAADYEKIEKRLSKYTSTGTVYGDEAAYYPAKKADIDFFLYPYALYVKNGEKWKSERKKIDTVILKRGAMKFYSSHLSGKWRKIKEINTCHLLGKPEKLHKILIKASGWQRRCFDLCIYYRK